MGGSLWGSKLTPHKQELGGLTVSLPLPLSQEFPLNVPLVGLSGVRARDLGLGSVDDQVQRKTSRVPLTAV